VFLFIKFGISGKDFFFLLIFFIILPLGVMAGYNCLSSALCLYVTEMFIVELDAP
jgi:hypothetical protein